MVGSTGQIRLLATGFGPFPGAPSNPTQMLMEHLNAQQWHPNGAHLFSETLPTQWSGASLALERHVQDLGPDAVVLFGLAAGARVIRIERRAQNHARFDRPDAVGICWAGPKLAPGSGAEHLTQFAIAPIVRAVRARGVAAALSRDCGDYVCNATYFSALSQNASGLVPPALFIHLPLPAEIARKQGLACPSGLTRKQVFTGAKAALQAVADALASARIKA